MTTANKFIIACGCLGAVVLAATGCSPRRIPPMTVADLMEDRVLLDGVLLKCNQNQSKASTDSDCLNARIAIERLASQSEPAKEAKRMEEFERSRDQLRMNQEKQRKEQESKTKIDAYHLPLVPVDPAPPSPAAPQPDPQSSHSNQPIVSRSTP
jgi:hypothetical protein